MRTTLPPTLAEAKLRFQHAAAEIHDTYEARRPAETDQVTPAQLSAAIDQFFDIITRLDREQGEIGPLKDDVTQLGDYGMTLLTDLAAWAAQLNMPTARHDLEIVTLAAADWIMRHQGQIRTLEPVVNALANFANRMHDPSSLSPFGYPRFNLFLGFKPYGFAYYGMRFSLMNPPNMGHEMNRVMAAWHHGLEHGRVKRLIHAGHRPWAHGRGIGGEHRRAVGMTHSGNRAPHERLSATQVLALQPLDPIDPERDHVRLFP